MTTAEIIKNINLMEALADRIKNIATAVKSESPELVAALAPRKGLSASEKANIISRRKARRGRK